MKSKGNINRFFGNLDKKLLNQGYPMGTDMSVTGKIKRKGSLKPVWLS
jgi:hypothetical protein